MANQQRQERAPRHRRRWTAIAIVVLALFGAATARLFIWPDLEPIPRHVDAIIETVKAAGPPVVLAAHSGAGASGYAATDTSMSAVRLIPLTRWAALR